MTHEEFNEVYYPKYNSTIKAIARKLAITHDALADDLYQEGLMALWLCTPAAAHKNPDAYIRQAIRFRMIDFLRREKISNFESLDHHLEKGRQVVRGDDGVEHILRYRERKSCTATGLAGRGEAIEDDEDAI